MRTSGMRCMLSWKICRFEGLGAAGGAAVEVVVGFSRACAGVWPCTVVHMAGPLARIADKSWLLCWFLFSTSFLCPLLK